ncbi:AAA family ATPase [Nocardioides sp. NPDC127503]|uniref:AAA family ATPase n=1 Tax=Nocardioides sp. NPDC127503 TaxID=3154516 RepID=UPI00332B8A13
MTGPMAVGKSTVAGKVAMSNDSVLLSFGDLVRAEAQQRDLSRDRATLQELGQELHTRWGPRGLSEALLQERRADVVIEGVRHLDVLEALHALMPDLVVVFLTAPPDVLDERWTARGATGARTAATIHGVESELDLLRNHASVIIDTAQISSDAAAQMITVAARATVAT